MSYVGGFFPGIPGGISLVSLVSPGPPHTPEAILLGTQDKGNNLVSILTTPIPSKSSPH